MEDSDNVKKTSINNNKSNKNEPYKGKKVDQFGNRYEGYLLNNKAEGHGIKYYSDGRKYEGEFKNDLRHGPGTLNRPDGSIFTGNYKNDYQDGIGINFTGSGKILKGYFKEGKVINGNSIMYYGNGNNDYLNFEQECVYEGAYKNGKREGYGIFRMINGDIYKGEFKDDFYNGKGVYIWNTGMKYTGNFRENKKDGYGVLYNPNFGKLVVLWKDDQPFQVNFENN